MSPVAPFLAPHRDDGFVIGRADRSGADYYTVPGLLFTGVSTAGPDNNTVQYIPFFVVTPLVIDQVASEVTAVGTGGLRMGLYRSDHDWQPIGPPLFDSGEIANTSTGVKTYTPTTPVFLSSGRYLSVLNNYGGGSMRRFNGVPKNVPLSTSLGSSPVSYYWPVAQTFGAFPTPGTKWITSYFGGGNDLRCFCVYRVKVP